MKHFPSLSLHPLYSAFLSSCPAYSCDSSVTLNVVLKVFSSTKYEGKETSTAAVVASQHKIAITDWSYTCPSYKSYDQARESE
jgi:hypothetical protein